MNAVASALPTAPLPARPAPASLQSANRRRRLKRSLQELSRLSGAINVQLDHAHGVIPEATLDDLSAALVSLGACLHRLTRPDR